MKQCFAILLCSVLAVCAAPARALPALPKHRAVAAPVAPPADVSDAVARIGRAYRVAAASFVPTYAADLSTVKIGGTLAQSLDKLALAIDGQVQQVTPSFWVVVPNFRVDAPSAPLVPQVRAAVRVNNGLAYVVCALPDLQSREQIFTRQGVSIATQPESVRAEIGALTLYGRPIPDELGGGAKNANLSISMRPEWIVAVHYGSIKLGSYDAWEQAGRAFISWDVAPSIDAAQISQVPAKVPLVRPRPVPLPIEARMLNVNRGRISGAELITIAGRGAGNIVLDASLAPRSVAITTGPYDARMLFDAACRCLQARVLPFDDPDARRTRWLLTGPAPEDDERIVRDAVEREIVRTWATAMTAADTAAPAPRAGPFGFDQAAGCATISYELLDSAQKAVVDELLGRLPATLTDAQRGRVTVTVRPGLVAQGRIGDDLVTTVEQSALLYSDVEPSVGVPGPAPR